MNENVEGKNKIENFCVQNLIIEPAHSELFPELCI